MLWRALLALVAAPLAAQSFSEGFTFLKAVRERDGATAERILANPSSTAINAPRRRRPARARSTSWCAAATCTWLAFMLGRGARPDIQSNDGTTPLILAAQIGWREGAEQLLARGANPNLGNRRGETPLILAVQRRDLQMVRLLLGQRADPNQTDNVAGYSAIDYARQDPRAAAILRELEQAPRPAPPRQRRPAAALVEPGEPRIEIAGQPPRGAAGEAQRLGLAPRRGERPAAAPPGSPPHRSGRRRSGRRNRGRARRRRTARARSRPAPPSRRGRNNRDSRTICWSPSRSARDTLISTMMSWPWASIAIMSARRPLGSGTSQIANMSARKNSRVTPRATSCATSGASAKQALANSGRAAMPARLE